jgi:hypothetical protein
MPFSPTAWMSTWYTLVCFEKGGEAGELQIDGNTDEDRAQIKVEEGVFHL